MKTKQKTIIQIVLVLLIGLALSLAACTDFQSNIQNEVFSDSELAQNSLINYLDFLHSGDYTSAAELYGGSYEILNGYNPDLEPTDYPALLERACTMNGFLCLQWMNIELMETISETNFTFSVEFQTEDGELVEVGPCCGESEVESPPRSVFTFTVVKTASDQFLVLDLPPYTP